MKHKIFFAISFISLLGCNSTEPNYDNSHKRLNSEICFSYPGKIDSMHIRNLYDSSRWAIFAWHCDFRYRPKYDTNVEKTFGQLELRFDTLLVKSDTVELLFNFYDKEKLVRSTTIRDFVPLHTGVAYNKETNKKIYMLSPSGFTTVIKGEDQNRYEIPLQPEVLEYIKNNWNKLDSCLKELAKQEGIMK